MMPTRQTIQHGPTKSTIAAVALTAFDALNAWPANRRGQRPVDGAIPPVADLPDILLRHLARAYQRTGLPAPEAVDDLEAVGEEIEQGVFQSGVFSPLVASTPTTRFWRMARDHHEAIVFLQSHAGRESAWIDVASRTPRDGQAVVYYFDIVGPHVGWYSNQAGGQWSGHNGFLGNEVSHWIALPG